MGALYLLVPEKVLNNFVVYSVFIMQWRLDGVLVKNQCIKKKIHTIVRFTVWETFLPTILQLVSFLNFLLFHSLDQWSPLNQEGKKQYDRGFLLQFQPDCTSKPQGLPDIPDIVLEKVCYDGMVKIP